MAEWLLLRLSRDSVQPPEWLVADAQGQLLAPPSTDTGDALAAAAHGRRVALIVPATDVLQLSANLPQAGEARLQQLVPFALEDQVSEDIDTLHFALGQRSPAGDTPVRVVARALLDEWLARAAALSLVPDAVHADSDLAPQPAANLSILIDDEHLVLRGEGAAPVVLPAADPVLALDLYLGADAAFENLDLAVHAAPEGWQRHGVKFEALRSRVATLKVQLSSGGVLPLLAQGMAAPGRINLLQGAYRPRTQGGGGSWRRWRVAAALGGALLLLHVGGRVWELQRLKGAERALDAQIEQAAAVALPGEPLGGDLQRRVEQRMQRVAGSAQGQGEWLHLLAAVAAAHDNVPVTRLESLTFKPGEMQLRVTGPDAGSLEQLSQALRAGGYSAQVTSGSAQEGGFQGRVELKGPGS